MKHRIACLTVAGLALVADPGAVTSASVVFPAPQVEILVGETPLRRYAHEGRWYIEALRGREYAIQLRNPYPVRVAVALSVDGLNTIDARETTAAGARKWVIDPYQTITISGWQTSRTEARRFEFTTEERSYARALGKTANVGVISAVFFRERVPEARLIDESARSQAAQPAASPRGDASALASRASEDYAATGMGRRTDHAVVGVRLDLEDAPSHSVSIRYEFRPQLVQLGILPRDRADEDLQRRERASGFEPGFAPVPLSLRRRGK